MAIIPVTWDFENKGNGIIEQDGLTASSPNRNTTLRASHGKSSGKWYWEIELLNNDWAIIGIVDEVLPIPSLVYNTKHARAVYARTGNKYSGGSLTYGSSLVAGDILGIAVDLDVGNIEFFINGVSQGVAFEDLDTMNTIYPMFTSGTATETVYVKANFGQQDFKHNIPHGYMPYNVFNQDKILLLSEDEEIMSLNTKSLEIIPEVYEDDPNAISEYGFNNSFEAFNSNDSYAQSELRREGAWIQYRIDDEVIPKSAIISVGGSSGARNCSITIKASSDGEIFDNIYYRDHWTDGKEEIIDFNTVKKYSYYRIVLDNWSGQFNYMIYVYRFQILKEELRTLKLPSLSEQHFIDHGMSPQEFSEVDFSSKFTEKHYIQNKSTSLGSGKVFEQPLDVDKIIKSVKIN